MKPNHNHSPIQSYEDWKQRKIKSGTFTQVVNEEPYKELFNESKSNEFKKLNDVFNKTENIVAEFRKKLPSEITADTIEPLENLRRFIFECIAVIENISFIMPVNCEFEENSKLYETNTYHYRQASNMFNFSLTEVEDSIKKIKNEQLDNLPKTFKTDYNPQQLNTIRERLIKAKIIDHITKNDFEYLFTKKPRITEMKFINWEEKRPLGHEFLKRVVYRNEKFDFKQVNDCIKSQDGKLFDSNCKSTAVYKNDILNSILDI